MVCLEQKGMMPVVVSSILVILIINMYVAFNIWGDINEKKNA